MGYFPNGMSGEYYQEQYCHRCINEDAENERWCPIWNWHLLHNYEECNKPDSWLHKLIPRTKDDVGNGQCVMFHERAPTVPDDLPPKSTAASIRTMGQLRAFIAKATP
jgi:hypothetical protein